MYYKLGQACVTNWSSYYKLGQPLLQNRAGITNWSKMYYKLGQVLQIRAIITNWGITAIIQIYLQSSSEWFIGRIFCRMSGMLN